MTLIRCSVSIKRMIAIRKKHAAFGGSSMEWIETGNSAVSVYMRTHEGEIDSYLQQLEQ